MRRADRWILAMLTVALAGPVAAADAAGDQGPRLVVDGNSAQVSTHTDRWPDFPAGQDTTDLDGPINDPQVRRDAHFDAAVDGSPGEAVPDSGPPVTPATTWCATGVELSSDDVTHARTTLPRYKVIYVRASDVPDHFFTYATLMQGAATSIANKISAGAGNLRAPRFDYGTSCGPQYLDIASLTLAQPAATYKAMTDDARATAIRAELRNAMPALALDRGLWNYLVFADGVSNTARGQGTEPLDDQPTAANHANLGGFTALIMGAGGTYFAGTGAAGGYNSADGFAYSVTHEVGHTLGTVQDSAPHSTLAGHCTDGRAIMCYDDKGPSGTGTTPYVTTACNVSGASTVSYDNVPFDCHDDDYLDFAPPAGSYLATHWNVFDNVFMCDTNTCTASTIRPFAVTDAPGSVPAGATVSVSGAASSDKDGAVADYRWDLDNAGTFATDTGTSAALPVTLDRAGTHVVRLRVTDNDGLTDDSAARTITFTDRAPTAAISVPASAGAGQQLTIDARGSADPDGGDHLTYQFTDGKGLNVASPTGVISYPAPAAGASSTLTVVVRDTAGLSASASGTVAVPLPPPPPPPPVATDDGPTGRASVLSVTGGRHGSVRVLLSCSKTGTGCSGSITVQSGRHQRSTSYKLKPGQRATKVLARPSGVTVSRRRKPSVLVQVVDYRAPTVRRHVHLHV